MDIPVDGREGGGGGDRERTYFFNCLDSILFHNFLRQKKNFGF